MKLRQLIRQLRGLINLGGGVNLHTPSNDNTPGVNTRKVQSLDVHTALRDQIDVSEALILPMDSYYWVPDEAGFHEVLSYHKNHAGGNIYQGDSYDCENFAIELLNLFQNRTAVNSVGLVYDGSSGHAYNVAVYDGPKGLTATLIEPNFWSMNGGEVEPTDSDGYYSVKQSTIFL